MSARDDNTPLMTFDVITLFPEMIDVVTSSSVIGRAREAGRIAVVAHQLRDYTGGSPHPIDDAPYGGGPGQVMRAEPIFDAVETVSETRRGATARKVLMTPQGRPFDQATAVRLACEPGLIMFCGRYEGVDERARSLFDEEISIGDYVLTGGEIGALAIVDAVARLLPGVLGSKDSPREESFSEGLLEYPQYTRPENFRGMQVPPVLLSGNHAAIRRWRCEQSLERTKQRRPDLLASRDGESEER